MRTDVDEFDSTGALHEHRKGVCTESGIAFPRDTKMEKSGCTCVPVLFAAEELQSKPQQ